MRPIVRDVREAFYLTALILLGTATIEARGEPIVWVLVAGTFTAALGWTLSRNDPHPDLSPQEPKDDRAT